MCPSDSRPSRRGPKVVRAGLCALLLAGLSACAPDDGPGDVAAFVAPPVMVVPVELRDVVDRIEATGELRAKADATIAAQVSGEVTAIRADEGDPVEAGQVLLEIDPQRRELELADVEARLEEARAQVVEGEREWARMQRLSKRDAASQARLDEAQTQLVLARSRRSGAQARLGLSQRALSDSTVTAPFAGLVSRRLVSAGEYVITGGPLFEVVALDPIEVEFTLAEVDSARVQLGHEVEIRVAPYPDERFTAVVSVISPTIDPATRTLRVKAELPNPGGRLRPGLFAHADLGVSRRRGVAVVPEDALVQRADGTVLFRLTEGSRVERLRVDTGIFRDGWVEIKSGLSAGDSVVLRGQSDLVEGSVVSVRTPEGRAVTTPQVAAPGVALEQGPGQ